MVMNTSCTAIRTDRGPSAAHGGTLLTSRTWTTDGAMNVTPKAGANVASKTVANVAPKAAFVGGPAYVVGQESHPPRGSSPV